MTAMFLELSLHVTGADAPLAHLAALRASCPARTVANITPVACHVRTHSIDRIDDTNYFSYYYLFIALIQNMVTTMQDNR